LLAILVYLSAMGVPRRKERFINNIFLWCFGEIGVLERIRRGNGGVGEW
jgi:hypothetical protein